MWEIRHATESGQIFGPRHKDLLVVGDGLAGFWPLYQDHF
jgi:hypothetical protein